MTERIAKGTWVEVERVVLPAGERAPRVPEETQRVALEMRVKGVLTHDAALGEEVELVTAAGRRIRGALRRAQPPYDHGFGAPIAELQSVGEELRALLRSSEEAP